MGIGSQGEDRGGDDKKTTGVSLLGKDLNTAVKWREITLRGLVRMKDKYWGPHFSTKQLCIHPVSPPLLHFENVNEHLLAVIWADRRAAKLIESL